MRYLDELVDEPLVGVVVELVTQEGKDHQGTVKRRYGNNVQVLWDDGPHASFEPRQDLIVVEDVETWEMLTDEQKDAELEIVRKVYGHLAEPL